MKISVSCSSSQAHTSPTASLLVDFGRTAAPPESRLGTAEATSSPDSVRSIASLSDCSRVPGRLAPGGAMRFKNRRRSEGQTHSKTRQCKTESNTNTKLTSRAAPPPRPRPGSATRGRTPPRLPRGGATEFKQTHQSQTESNRGQSKTQSESNRGQPNKNAKLTSRLRRAVRPATG